MRPHTKYQLRLIKENLRGQSVPSEPTPIFYTNPTYPEIFSEKVYAEPISSEKIQINWTPLLPNYWNGDPIGYLIFFRVDSNSSKHNEWVIFIFILYYKKNDCFFKKEQLVSNIKASDFILTNLHPFTSYQIKICAKNTFGNSNFSNIVKALTYENSLFFFLKKN